MTAEDEGLNERLKITERKRMGNEEIEIRVSKVMKGLKGQV